MAAMTAPPDGAATLYMGVEAAAAWAGIGKNTMRDFVNSADPPPMLVVGKTHYIQRAALAAYLERKQQVRETRERR